jgi:isoquinoline 1-oxidoreductase subunit beta
VDKSANVVECFEPERFELRESLPYHFSCDRREFLQFTGAGLLFVALATRADGQRGAPATTTLGARLHIGTDGVITVLSGKVEEGQGALTELGMAAAEELRVPMDRVRVQMADTDLTPSDGITAGSRTTPGNVPPMRRAAAAARELLLDTAAEQWKVDRAALRVQDGAVTQGGRKFTYADLAQNPSLAAAYARTPGDTALTPSSEWRVLGVSHHRSNAHDIVTGTHKFPADIVRPNMLYGCVLRPPSFGATLESVDASETKKLPDVSVVHDGDFAGCTAPTRYHARKAVARLAASAKWRTKDHPSSATLFEHLKKHAGADPRAQLRGSIEEGFRGAAKRLQATYQTAYVQHAPMEPRAAAAEWGADGRLTVWTGTSNPFSVRDQLAQAFKLKAEQVRVIVPDFGGGFGGKHTGEAAIEAARLAKEAKRPVHVQWTRGEEFMWAYARPAALIETEAALDGKGSVVAWDFANYNSGGSAIDTPYRIANVRTRFIQSDSPLRQGSYRALASTANNFARECFMDELAAAAGRDPLEFRLAHLDNPRIREVLLAAAGKFGWAERSKNPRPGRAVGLACGTEKNSVVAACAEVEVDAGSGSPRLVELVQAFECGAILNPVNLRAQIEGCILMGLGAVLREEMLFENGRLTNGSFARYRPTRFRDVPSKMEIIMIDKKDQEPIGAGETPIIAVAPAMANAMFHLVGRRVRALPLRAPRGTS